METIWKNEILYLYDELYKPNKNIRELNKVEFLDKIASIIKVLLNQNYSSEISIRSPKFFHFFSQKNIEKKIYVN